MAEQLRSFLRLKKVKEITGMSRSWIYAAIQKGEFPAPISLGARAVGWLEDEIETWRLNRIQKSRGVSTSQDGGTAKARHAH
jgi:prophage regulatory protein